MQKRDYIYIGIVVLAFVIFSFNLTNEEPILFEEVNEEIEVVESFEGEINITEDGIKYIVHPSKILSGGPPKDGIPSIDYPKFVSMSDAREWIKDNELVLFIEYKDEVRIYPLQILVWHEIVTEVIKDDPILITYCPLCGTGIAYGRTINGEAVEFGTSGKLFNSNLVMYDRLTDTYWSQIDGKAIVGELTGTELKEISIDTLVWRDIKDSFEDAKVLSKDTGFFRDYGEDPYGNYYENSFLIFPVENEDNRVHPKTVVHGIYVDGVYKAYRDDEIKEKGSFEDEINNIKISVSADESGRITFTNLKNNTEIVKERGFWFSWYAFHPNTLLYGME
ncbi:DUF3179 domain-containing protein [Candidatus Woesearchaeota archaeon]|nr:DUF3179 domain-containing protein [Candidatus Woesearchaeota archaeon]